MYGEMHLQSVGVLCENLYMLCNMFRNQHFLALI